MVNIIRKTSKNPAVKALKITTCAVIRKGDKFLLVRRKMGKYHGGLWTFPGGRPDARETADQAVKREVREETGLEVSVQNLLFAYAMKNDHPTERGQHPYIGILFYRCKPLTQKVTPGDDADRFAWMTLEGMKALKMRPAMYKAIKKIAR